MNSKSIETENDHGCHAGVFVAVGMAALLNYFKYGARPTGSSPRG